MDIPSKSELEARALKVFGENWKARAAKDLHTTSRNLRMIFNGDRELSTVRAAALTYWLHQAQPLEHPKKGDKTNV